MDEDQVNIVANDALLKVRNILWQAGIVDQTIPYSVLVCLIAESAMLTSQPDNWTAELVEAAHECRDMKMASLLHERAFATSH